RYRRHPGQISASIMWEREQRVRAARLQLRAAWALGLAPHLWVFPICGWLYATLPASLRPRRIKETLKRWLWQRFGTPSPKVAEAAKRSKNEGPSNHA